MTKAKKSYGQHFLKDQAVCTAIADHILNLEGVELIIEVGPGKGALTQLLLESPLPVYVVEADRDMVAHLKTHLPDLPHDHIISGDFLKTNLSSLIKGRQAVLVGNFPYNISTQIVFNLLKNVDHYPHMVGMFQKEVSDRIISPHGSKVYGILSVLSAALYKGKEIIQVPPSAFSPPPKVQSSVIHLERLESPADIRNQSLFKRVVKAAFGQRRKMVRNSVKSIGAKGMDLNDPVFNKRPEQMPLEDFIHLTEILDTHGLQ